MTAQELAEQRQARAREAERDLRDRFAMAVLPALVIVEHLSWSTRSGFKVHQGPCDYAITAYKLADAMLEARQAR